MTNQFSFNGQTTFINQPRDTVISNFQNQYITGDNSVADQVNSELMALVKLILDSKDLPNETKEDATQAVHTVAEQVKEQKPNRLTLKGTLTQLQVVLSTAADVAAPAAAIIAAVAKLLGFA